jgi:pentatricopeptide repeat protein
VVARARAASLGLGQLELWAYLTESHVLEGLGRHQDAIKLGRDGLARARQLGFDRQIAAPIAGNLADSLTSAGRWDEALEVLEEILVSMRCLAAARSPSPAATRKPARARSVSSARSQEKGSTSKPSTRCPWPSWRSTASLLRAN